MKGKFLLDTNIAVAMLNGDAAIMEVLAEGPELYISATVLGELFYGAYKSNRTKSNLSKIENLYQHVTCLDCNQGTARNYGQIRLQVQRKGRPIPDNDLWVAASAIAHNLVLVTRDDHFSAIDGLQIERW